MVVDNINNPLEVKIYNEKQMLSKTVAMPGQINGYEYEIRETIECIKKAKRSVPP